MNNNLEYSTQTPQRQKQKTPEAIQAEVQLQESKVVEIAEDSQHILVERAGGTYRTKRAASCLSLPQKGDKVLFCYSPQKTGYILAVLETALENNHNIQVAADSVSITSQDMVLESKDMSLVTDTLLQASQSKIETSKDVIFSSQDLKMQVEKVSFFAQSISSHIANLSQVFTSVMTKAQSIFTKAETRQEYLVNSTHKISGIQISEAKETLLKAEGNVSIQAKNVLMN